MRWWLLMLVAGVHVVAAGIAAPIFTAFHLEPEIALVVAAVLGSQVGAWVYHKGHPEPAPATVKAVVGLVLAVMCVIETLIALYFWHWTQYPEVVIPISAIGTFFFPFGMFGSMQKALAKADERKKAKAQR